MSTNDSKTMSRGKGEGHEPKGSKKKGGPSRGTNGVGEGLQSLPQKKKEELVTYKTPQNGPNWGKILKTLRRKLLPSYPKRNRKEEKPDRKSRLLFGCWDPPYVNGARKETRRKKRIKRVQKIPQGDSIVWKGGSEGGKKTRVYRKRHRETDQKSGKENRRKSFTTERKEKNVCTG